MINSRNNAVRIAAWLLGLSVLNASASAQEWRIVVDPFDGDFSSTLPAQPLGDLSNVEIDPTLLELVRQLDDPAFDKREQAAEAIIERAGDKVQLYAILNHGGLTIEQRYRLLQVVREYLLEIPRGAVGISMQSWQPGMPLQDAGVRVAELVPGMPAERVLQVGDRIMSIDGHPLATQNDLIVYVQNKRPGEKIMMMVKRSRVDDRGDLVLDERNQPVADDLQIELELGSFEALKNARQPNFRVGPSPVEQQRAREASEVAERFAPTPTTVKVTGEGGREYSFTATSVDDGVFEIGVVDARIDAHPMVRQLLRDFELIDSGRMHLTPELRRQWYQGLQQFADETERIQMNEDLRLINRQVIVRYMQLLNARLRKVVPAEP